MTIPKVFCEHCGSPCGISKEANGQFDCNTGKPYFLLRIKCPKARFYSIAHTSYLHTYSDGMNTYPSKMYENAADEVIQNYTDQL